MKRLLSIVMLMVLIMSISVSAQESKELPQESKELTKWELHEIMIDKAQNEDVIIVNEYDMIKGLQAMDEKQLEEEKLTKKDVIAMEAEMIQELERRSTLGDDELRDLGYDDMSIAELKSLKGVITLEAASTRGLFADCYVYSARLSHTYSGSKTRFKVQFGWQWDMCPVICLKDGIGIGWNGDFALESGKDNELDVVYYAPGYGDYDTHELEEVVINNAEVQFELCDRSGNSYDGMWPYARSGVGVANLIQSGKMENAKFSFHYGHNTIGIAPSVSYPGGVSFSLTGDEYEYAAPVLNSQRNF